MFGSEGKTKICNIKETGEFVCNLAWISAKRPGADARENEMVRAGFARAVDARQAAASPPRPASNAGRR